MKADLRAQITQQVREEISKEPPKTVLKYQCFDGGVKDKLEDCAALPKCPEAKCSEKVCPTCPSCPLPECPVCQNTAIVPPPKLVVNKTIVNNTVNNTPAQPTEPPKCGSYEVDIKLACFFDSIYQPYIRDGELGYLESLNAEQLVKLNSLWSRLKSEERNNVKQSYLKCLNSGLQLGGGVVCRYEDKNINNDAYMDCSIDLFKPYIKEKGTLNFWGRVVPDEERPKIKEDYSKC